MMTSDEEGLTGSLMLSQVRVIAGSHQQRKTQINTWYQESSQASCFAISAHQRTARAERGTCMVHSTPYSIERCVCDASLPHALPKCTKTLILVGLSYYSSSLYPEKNRWKSSNNLEATSSMSLNLGISVLLFVLRRACCRAQQYNKVPYTER